MNAARIELEISFQRVQMENKNKQTILGGIQPPPSEKGSDQKK